MKARTEFDAKPFRIPNFVLNANKDDTQSGVPIKELDAFSLENLCREFVDGVFEKAEKPRPKDI